MTDMTESEVPGLMEAAANYYRTYPNELVFSKMLGYYAMTADEAVSLLTPADIETAQARLEQMQMKIKRERGGYPDFPDVEFVRPGFYVTLMLKDVRANFWHNHVEVPPGKFKPTY